MNGDATLAALEQAAGVTDPLAFWVEVLHTTPAHEDVLEYNTRGFIALRWRIHSLDAGAQCSATNHPTSLEQAAGVTDPAAFWAEIARGAVPGQTIEDTIARGLRYLTHRAAARAQGVAA